MNKKSSLSCLPLLLALFISTQAWSKERALFLNGIDISSAKHQTLENVTVKIDGQGHIYIVAPHYEVNQESTYIPLSTWNQKPEHKPLNKVPQVLRELGASEALPSLKNQAKPLKAQDDSPKLENPGTQGEQNPGQISRSDGTDSKTSPASR